MTLKTNSKRILDIIAGQEAKNATAAYKAVHPTASDITARTDAYKLLKKPEAQIYLQNHIDKARNKIVELVDSDKQEISLKASQDVLDRTQGKATQRIEAQSTSVNIVIDLGSNTSPETLESPVIQSK